MQLTADSDTDGTSIKIYFKNIFVINDISRLHSGQH